VEIAPVPHRATRGERTRLVLGLLVLAPVVLLVLLPAVLGLDRYVMTESGMAGAVDRGSVVLAHEVAPTDLHVGDVVTYQPPAGASDERVTRRIVALDGGVAVTRADRSGVADPWTLPLTDPTYTRVWVSVPWIGYPFVLDGGWLLLGAPAAVALVLALVSGRPAPHGLVRTTRTSVPVA
jgi:signal peptidase